MLLKILIFFLFFLAFSLNASPIFWGPTAYTSEASIPQGFYSGQPVVLENFEDASLHPSISASNGYVVSGTSNIDSVDGDDGSVDGSGLTGKSWFYSAGSTGVVFTFNTPELPTSAGIVWTDGGGTTTFEAFGIGMVSLGKIGPVSIADGVYTGTTAEDRFFGVQYSAGILAIKISNTSGGIEVDHLQYGSAVPEPNIFMLLCMGIFFLFWLKKR